MVPYGLEHPKDRAPQYWAVSCFKCPVHPNLKQVNNLKMVDGVLLCPWCRGERERPPISLLGLKRTSWTTEISENPEWYDRSLAMYPELPEV